MTIAAGQESAVLAIALVILAVVLAAVLASAGWVVRRQINAGAETRAALVQISNDLSILNTGASAGARTLITDLRADLGRLRDELDELAERHGNAQIGSAQLAERVNGLREQIAEINRHLRGSSPAPRV